MGQFQTLKIAAVFFLKNYSCLAKILNACKIIDEDETDLKNILENRKNILAAWPLISGKITNYNANFNDDPKHLHNKMITRQ